MTKQVEAVYENGVLRPLEPLPLVEHQRVRVTISDVGGDPLAECIPTHEEVRRMSAKDPSSWAEGIRREREDRF